ncbi:hypothetical protein BHE74_00026090, partial [Ensete ventricosum]
NLRFFFCKVSPKFDSFDAGNGFFDVRSGFLSGSPRLDVGKAGIVLRIRPSSVSPALSRRFGVSFIKKTGFAGSRIRRLRVSARATVETAVVDADTAADVESLFSESAVDDAPRRQGKKKSSAGASSVSSGVRLENISKSFKGVTLLKDVSWEVKKGEKVGLVGVNGAGKTTQLRIIAELEEPDSGNVVKAKENMKIAFLSQEFEVCQNRTVKEEFLSVFKEETEVADSLEKVQKALESSVEDMSLMARLLDELDLLQRRSQDLDLDQVDVKISKLMPQLGFAPEDSDRLVASFSSGWQMRMSLGKILLQECLDPDLLLLDEPTNHLDLDAIEWLEGYLNKQDVPMVIVSHDRAFLDQLCTKMVETDMGVSRSFMGNYSEYVLAKAAWVESQHVAWEKQQKEIEHTRDLINRLGAGVNAGRASSEEKVATDVYYLEKNLEARERELEREAELEERAPKAKAKSKMSKACFKPEACFSDTILDISRFIQEMKAARKKQKMLAFQQANAKSKGLKNAKRWK